MSARYLVLRTAFHGGGLISAHRLLARAEASARRHQSGECSCGCAIVHDLQEQGWPLEMGEADSSGYTGESPYEGRL